MKIEGKNSKQNEKENTNVDRSHELTNFTNFTNLDVDNYFNWTNIIREIRQFVAFVNIQNGAYLNEKGY